MGIAPRIDDLVTGLSGRKTGIICVLLVIRPQDTDI